MPWGEFTTWTVQVFIWGILALILFGLLREIFTAP